MSERDLITSTKSSALEPTFGQRGLSRAKFLKIKPAPNVGSIAAATAAVTGISPGDLEQVERTMKAIAIAEMPFRPIANHFEGLGFEIEEGEVDVLIKRREPGKTWEVVRLDDGGVWAWQDRGEIISINHQLDSPVTIDESTNPVHNPTVNNSVQNLRVLEGIGVFPSNENLSPQLPTTQHQPQPVGSPASQVGTILNEAIPQESGNVVPLDNLRTFIKPLTDQQVANLKPIPEKEAA